MDKMIKQSVDLLALMGFKVIDVIYNSIQFEAPGKNENQEYVLIILDDNKTFCLYNADPEGMESDPDPIAEGTDLPTILRSI